MTAETKCHDSWNICLLTDITRNAKHVSDLGRRSPYDHQRSNVKTGDGCEAMGQLQWIIACDSQQIEPPSDGVQGDQNQCAAASNIGERHSNPTRQQRLPSTKGSKVASEIAVSNTITKSPHTRQIIPRRPHPHLQCAQLKVQNSAPQSPPFNSSSMRNPGAA